jgi:hypothetical protein
MTDADRSSRYPLAQLFPDTTMQAGTISRAGGEIPCVIITPPCFSPPPPILVYHCSFREKAESKTASGIFHLTSSSLHFSRLTTCSA